MTPGRDPGDIDVVLNKKAINFILLAIERQLDHMNAQLSSGRLTEDEESEIGNDRDYLQGLRAKFDALAHRRAGHE